MSRSLLDRAVAYAETVLTDLTDADLRRATPCEGWDVGRVVLHLADVADALVDLLDTGRLALPEPQRTDDPDPVCVLRSGLIRLDARLASAVDPERVAAAAQAGAIELTMHGWDIGVARDPGHATPPRLAGEVLELATSIVDDDIRDPIFAPPAEVPAEAPAAERLAAFLGRSTRGRGTLPATEQREQAGEALVPVSGGDPLGHQRLDLAHPGRVHAE